MKTSLLLLFLYSHSSGPKADSSPKGSRGLGGLKSEFLKQSAARGFRTQDQPAGSKGKRWLLRGGDMHAGVRVGVNSVGLHGRGGPLSVCARIWVFVCVCISVGVSVHVCLPISVWGF